MAVIIGSKEQVENYFAEEKASQSELKNLREGLSSFLAKDAKRKKDIAEGKPTPDYFLIGSGVDVILTGEEGQFEEEFYVSDVQNMPSDKEKMIVESVFKDLGEVAASIDFEDCVDAILAAADEFNWQSKWKDATRIDKIIKVGTEYFEDLCNAGGKTVISPEIRMKIDSIVHSLKTNLRTAEYFDRDIQETLPNVDFYYQLPIYFDYEGLECKALLDMVVVEKDEEDKIKAIHPIDLKTMSGDTLTFSQNLKKHRYDIQAAWYTLALTKYFKCAFIEISPFLFIVESTTNPGTPLVYKLTRDTVILAKMGRPSTIVETEVGTARQLVLPEIKGFDSLVKEYLYYQENGFQEDYKLRDTEIGKPLTLCWDEGII